MKINVPSAKALKHYKHDLSHDVSTTCEFGHLQPLMVREIIGNSKNSLRLGQIVRMMPMVLPTFGRITYNTYNIFVPMESIYHPYGSLRSKQTYMGANRTYIPTEVLNIRPATLDFIFKYTSRKVIFGVLNPRSLDSGSMSFGKDDVNYVAGGVDLVFQHWTESRIADLGLSTSTIWDNQHFGQYGSIQSSEADVQNLDFNKFDWVELFTDVQSSNATYLICGNYTDAFRDCRKVLYGCGYKLIPSVEPVSALPIFAYWKAYFDLFYPKRELTWKDTNAAGIQEYCEQYGQFTMENIINVKPDLFFGFINDLCDTYYTQNPDFVASHISGQRISNVAPEIFVNRGPTGEVLYTGSATDTSFHSSSTQAVIGSSMIDAGVSIRDNVYPNLLNQSNLDILQRIYHRINAKTAIGADIRAFLKTQLGVDYLDEDESYWIGSTKLDVNMTPVFSQAETAEGTLGEFAGQGSGAKNSDTFTYEAKVDGYWVCMVAIVPDSKMCQGMDMCLKHVRAVDFYDPQYDSLTLLPTPKKFIFAERQYMSDLSLNAAQNKEFDDSFGNIPNGIEYCVAQNLQNGDMSLASKRTSYLPFTLDKILPYSESFESVGVVSLQNTNMTVVVNSVIWRYIGLYKWLGLLDRVFVESGTITPISETADYLSRFKTVGIDDKFVCHNYLDFVCWNSKLPVRDSFQTGVFDTGSVTVEKA